MNRYSILATLATTILMLSGCQDRQEGLTLIYEGASVRLAVGGSSRRLGKAALSGKLADVSSGVIIPAEETTDSGRSKVCEKKHSVPNVDIHANCNRNRQQFALVDSYRKPDEHYSDRDGRKPDGHRSSRSERNPDSHRSNRDRKKRHPNRPLF